MWGKWQIWLVSAEILAKIGMTWQRGHLPIASLAEMANMAKIRQSLNYMSNKMTNVPLKSGDFDKNGKYGLNNQSGENALKMWRTSNGMLQGASSIVEIATKMANLAVVSANIQITLLKGFFGEFQF